MALDAYAYERSEAFHTCGAYAVDEETRDLAGALFLIKATLTFGPSGDTVLVVKEVVEETPTGEVHRLEYSYQLMYRSQFLFRYDRDPENHPEMPEHKHLPPDERRVPSGRVTFREIVDEVYDLLAELEAEV